MFFKSFLVLAAILALVQFSVALHAEKPGASLRRSSPPLPKRSLGKSISSKVKHNNLAVPAVRRNLIAEAREFDKRDDDDEKSCDDDYGLCDESGECCPLDTKCCDDGNCVKDGETCCTDGGTCEKGKQCCDDGCIGEDDVCCGDYNCGEDEQCCGDDECAPEDAECCKGGGYCDDDTKCMIWKGDDEDKMVCCKDDDCSESDGDSDNLPTPKGAGNRAKDSANLWCLAGSMALPAAAAAWL